MDDSLYNALLSSLKNYSSKEWAIYNIKIVGKIYDLYIFKTVNGK